MKVVFAYLALIFTEKLLEEARENSILTARSVIRHSTENSWNIKLIFSVTFLPC